MEQQMLAAWQLLAIVMFAGGASIAATAIMSNKTKSRPAYLMVGVIMVVAGAVLFSVL